MAAESKSPCHHPSNIENVDLQNLRWVLQGNVAVLTGNPFDPVVQDQYDKVASVVDEDCIWLGPGLQLLLDHVLAVSQEGKIVWLAPARDSQSVLQSAQQLQNCHFIRLESTLEFLCPGMIDLHIHAPQFSYTGTATDLPLTGPDGWLETYTFPAERRLKNNLPLARRVYQCVVQTTLENGTTTAVYFGTLHLKPNQILVDVCLEYGQRALVGKVCMDRNAPHDYVQTLEENIEETRELIHYIEHHPQNSNPLVLPLITPRFIPTCSPELLTALGDIAAEHPNCHITSHISESIDEVAWSKHLDEQDHGIMDRTDAAMFHSHKLLTDRCIMAHGVHLSDADADILMEQGTAVAHCPLSNFFFAGGVFPCRRMMQRGNKVGLGTDVAGGYSPSMLQAARTTVVASQSLQAMHTQMEQQPTTNDTTESILDYRHAFYLATLGGAEALGLQHQIGNLQVGMSFDAFILSAKGKSNITVFPDFDSLADVFQKLLVLGDDRNISHVFVKGREVKRQFQVTSCSP